MADDLLHVSSLPNTSLPLPK